MERQALGGLVGRFPKGSGSIVINLDELSERIASTGIALNLEGAEVREPFRLSTRMILRERPCFSPAITGPIVHVTENPNIIAAAANQLGSRSAPILSTEGQEKTAMRLLLSILQESGIAILYHGDFDWPGISIGNLIMTRHGAKPWQFSAQDYVAAPAGKPLDGPAVSACWDPDLQKVMKIRGMAVHEEAVVDRLISDLSQTWNPNLSTWSHS